MCQSVSSFNPAPSCCSSQCTSNKWRNFHMYTFYSILGLRWQHYVSNLEVLDCLESKTMTGKLMVLKVLCFVVLLKKNDNKNKAPKWLKIWFGKNLSQWMCTFMAQEYDGTCNSQLITSSCRNIGSWRKNAVYMHWSTPVLFLFQKKFQQSEYWIQLPFWP